MFNVSPVLSLVISIAFSIDFCKLFVNPFISPITLIRMFCLSFSFIKASTRILSIAINADTSFLLLFQFSVENAYTVKYFIPILLQNFDISSSACAPALCPSLVVSPLSFAHLLFPSIIIAICFGKFSLSISFIFSPFYLIFVYTILSYYIKKMKAF